MSYKQFMIVFLKKLNIYFLFSNFNDYYLMVHAYLSNTIYNTILV